jgi:hypothetical protein
MYNLVMEEEFKNKWNEAYPFWIEHGVNAGYHWFQSNYSIQDKFLEICPEILTDKWAAMTKFDHADMTPLVPSKETQDVWMGAPKLISSFTDLPWSGNEDEFYFYDGEPSAEMIAAIGKDISFGMKNISLMETSNDPELLQNWERILESGAETYWLDHNMEFIATKNQVLAARFLESEIVKSIPTLQIDINERRLRGWLAMATTDEPCGASGCNANRIPYGANCPRHHFEMLFATKFPDELL